MKFTTFKLMDGLQPISWQLPLTEVLIEKIKNGKSQGLKKIKFVPGVDSFFTEDLSGDLKPQQIWFTKGELVIPNIDKVQIALLKAHPWYGKKYKVFSQKQESLQKLDALRVSAEATRLIDEADSEKIKAIALGIFGLNSSSWDEATAELNLREYAKRKPKELQSVLNSKDYESKYLAALAFSKGIVKDNIGKTAVVWNDTTGGVILKLAQGESGVHKLGDLLSISDEKSLLIVQEIGARIDKVVTKTTPADLIASKDDEIAQLKAQLAEANKKPEKPHFSKNGSVTLEEASKGYEKKFGKKVPNNKKNDLDWVLSRL